MPVRETSRESYSQLQKEGKLGEQSKKILDHMRFCVCPQSLQELKRSLKIDINAVSGRVNDLKKAGLVYEWPKRKCSITGRLIIPVWNKEKTELF